MEGSVQSPMGILVVDKHAGVTSNGIVVRLRRLYGTRQIGHTGTLDPMATGVLPVLIGRAVKASDFLTAEDKRYEAELLLGLTTDTEDVTGTVLTELLPDAPVPEEAEVRRVIAGFVGEIMQTPPMVSALKVNGRKLVDLARQGVEVEREPRPVTIFSIGIERLDVRRYRLDVACSKGTYIRTLCADIGRTLGCGAVMSALRRTQSGPFTLADSVTLASLEQMTPEERFTRLLPLDRFFASCPAVPLSDFHATLARNGCTLSQSKLKTAFPPDTLVRLYHNDEFFALAKSVETEDGGGLKTVKLFRLEV